MAITLHGTNGVTFPDNRLQSTSGSSYGYKNLLTNGAMMIAQRATSATNVGTTSALAYCTVDRYQIYRGSGVTGLNAQQFSTGGPSDSYPAIPYYVRIQRASGNTTTNSLNIEQALTTQDSIPLQGKTVTFSFYARAGANFSGSHIWCAIPYGYGTNNSGWNGLLNGVYNSYTNFNITSSWQRFSATVYIPTGATQVLCTVGYAPTGTASTNDYIDVTGWQLEIGSVASQFEIRSYQDELYLCKYYYQSLVNHNLLVHTASVASFGGCLVNVSLTPSMRDANSTYVTITNIGSNAWVVGSPEFTFSRTLNSIRVWSGATQTTKGAYCDFTVTLDSELI